MIEQDFRLQDACATFDLALVAKRAAKIAADDEQSFEAAVEAVDVALEDLLASHSPTVAALSRKLTMLEREYGCDWQPRHVQAIIVDIRQLAAREDEINVPRSAVS